MIRLCVILLAAALAACSSTAGSSAASIPGPNSIAVSGRRLFVASTANDELRVLDLAGSNRRFVRAPNPLFPLSVPTAPFPRAVAAFTAYTRSASAPISYAVEREPAFSFALSTAASLVTVVSNSSLASLGTIAVPDTSLAIAVTRPTGAEEPFPERLITASTLEGRGALHAVSIASAADIAVARPVQVVDLGLSVPQVLVASPVNPDLVAVGDRSIAPDGLGRQGGLAICNVATGSVIRVDVGGPVLALSFSTEGNLLYGLLDTEACGVEAPCGGLFAVDLTVPAAPVLKGRADVPGTALGLAAGADAEVTFPSGATTKVDPLVMVSSSDGMLYAFDGDAVVPLDAGESTAASVSSFVLRNPDGTVVASPTSGPVDASGALSVGLDRARLVAEDVSIVWEGVLVQGTAGKPVPGAIEDVFDFPRLGVAVGDRVEVSGVAGSCGQATVSAVSAGRLELGGQDTSCLPASFSYKVRAAGQFAVSGSKRGFLGRVLPEGTFDAAGLTFTMRNPAGLPPVDAAYVLTISPGRSPFTIPMGTGVTMPGSMAFDPVNRLFYAAYTGGNALVELNPVEMRSGRGDLGVGIYR